MEIAKCLAKAGINNYIQKLFWDHILSGVIRGSSREKIYQELALKSFGLSTLVQETLFIL